MNFATALSGVKVVYLDSSAVIDYAERRSASVRVLQTFFERIRRGEIKGVSSAILLPEVLNYARENAAALALPQADRNQIEGGFQAIIDLLELKAISVETGYSAAEARRDYGLKTADAMHFAAALHQGADALLTCDGDFLRAQGVPIGNPGDGRTLKIVHALRVSG